MTPQERALFDTLKKNPGVKLHPEEWAQRAWPTAFVCKRSQKAKAPQSIQNAVRKCSQILAVFVGKSFIKMEWEYNPDKGGHRLVYWRERCNDGKD